MPFIPNVGVVQSAVFAPALPVLEGTRELAGQGFADFSGGLVATGSICYNETPQWEGIGPFSIGTTTVPKRLYLEGIGRSIQDEARLDHPATGVSWNGFAEYYRLVNGRLGSRIVGFPTSLEWLVAASPVVDVRQLMEAKGIRAVDLPDVADGWLEKFFTELGKTIYMDLRRPDFQVVLASSARLLAYHVYGTESGKLGEPGEEAWYAQEGTAPVKGRKPNKHDLHDATGNVWELVGDGQWRGGSWRNDVRSHLQVARRFRGYDPSLGFDNLGSRPAALR